MCWLSMPYYRLVFFSIYELKFSGIQDSFIKTCKPLIEFSLFHITLKSYGSDPHAFL